PAILAVVGGESGEFVVSLRIVKNLILLVHGLGGSAEQTWGALPRLIRDDPELSARYDVHCFGYSSAIAGSTPSLQTIAGFLKTEIEARYAAYPSIAIIGPQPGRPRRALAYRGTHLERAAARHRSPPYLRHPASRGGRRERIAMASRHQPPDQSAGTQFGLHAGAGARVGAVQGRAAGRDKIRRRGRRLDCGPGQRGRLFPD